MYGILFFIILIMQVCCYYKVIIVLVSERNKFGYTLLYEAAVLKCN